ncbi:MAG TPA: hypothetical protein PLI53_04860 [Geobacteraceae bacterium]|nr:hypothetical protein [Geobacteraceae bacterium]
MRGSTQLMYTEEVRQSIIAATYPVLYTLLQASKSMLQLVRESHAGTPEGDAVIEGAEKAIANAEDELQKGWKKHPHHKSGFFGRVGNHYDFEIHVVKVQERIRIFRCEGRDKVGRTVMVRIKKMDEPISIKADDTIFFRGKIRDHRLFHGEPVTYIDATSGILKV